MNKLELNKKNEIDNFFNKYSALKAKYQIKEYSKMNINLYINNFSDLELLNDFLYDIDEEFKNRFSIYDLQCIDELIINNTYNDTKFYFDISNLKDLNEYDRKTSLEFLKQYYIKKDELDYKNYEYIPTYINSLYVNDKEFKSDKYKVEFIYSPYYKEYLTILGYGIEFEYNGGVADYMQREIITDYLSGRYQIYNETHKTEYEIGNDKYEIYMLPENSDEKKTYYFKRNGEKLNIKLAKSPLYVGSNNATYYYYLKLSDWAKLLNCEYEIKDNQIYITTLQ